MSTWFFYRNGQQQGPVTDEVFRQLVQSGQVGPSDLVWREGMQEWLPLQTLAAQHQQRAQSQQQAVEPQHQQPAHQFGPAPTNQYQPQPGPSTSAQPQTGGQFMSASTPRSAAKAYAIALAAFLGLYVLSLILLGSIGGTLTTANPEQALTALVKGGSIAQLIVSILIFAAWLVLILAGACWQYHANTNLRVARLQGTPNPLGSVFWWYIPLVNWVMPIISLAGTTKASVALANGRDAWRNESTTGVFKAWAAAFILSVVCWLLFLALALAGSSGTSFVFLALFVIAWLIAAILLAVLFSSITTLQEKFVR
ncbi:MAG: DUF4339 domain-containing protein [Hyphomicrobiaceae bacterium]|nr:MAG: DUF4339 domain-containing protein [Hyphomicrobiaceae bacterium]